MVVVLIRWPYMTKTFVFMVFMVCIDFYGNDSWSFSEIWGVGIFKSFSARWMQGICISQIGVFLWPPYKIICKILAYLYALYVWIFGHEPRSQIIYGMDTYLQTKTKSARRQNRLISTFLWHIPMWRHISQTHVSEKCADEMILATIWPVAYLENRQRGTTP